MTDPKSVKRIAGSLIGTMLVLFVVLVGFAISRKMGWVPPDMGKRGAASAFGGMIVVLGNFLPKLHYFRADGVDPQGAMAVERIAGWALVLAGLASMLLWIVAPLDFAAMALPMLQIAAFTLAGGYALYRLGFRHRTAGLASDTPLGEGRMAIALMLSAMLGTSFIFLADWMWGDAVAQPLSIVIAMMVVLAGASTSTKLRRQRKQS